MPRKETSRNIRYRLAITVIIGAVLAACTPEGQVQEIKPAISQTIEIAVASATLNATATATKTEIPSSTSTPEATATPTATTTPENTPTPKAPEFPSDLVIDERYHTEKGNLGYYDWGEGYITYGLYVFIRTQDAQYEQPFTMLNGRYHVQAWADAWFSEPDGTGHHITVPMRVFDTENFLLWKISLPWIQDYSDKPSDSKNRMLAENTGPWNKNIFAEAQEKDMCLTKTGIRGCDINEPFRIEIGSIPSNDISNSHYINNFQGNVEFWRDLIEIIYTDEQIEKFKQTLDVNILKLNDPNLPPDFIIPLQVQ